MRRHILLLLASFSVAVSLPLRSLGAESELVARSNEILLELQRYDTQLEGLETQFGPYHRSLLEPLQSIVQLLVEQGDYQQVAEVQTRQLGVMRTVLGLEHPDLIPVVNSIIENQKRLSNWEAVTDNLELLRVITLGNFDADSDEAFRVIEDQAQWLQTLLYLDLDDREQARNFMKARDLYDDLLDLAEERWGEDSPELYPWLYKRAHNLAQLVGLVNTDDSLAVEMVQEVSRSDGFSRLEQGSGRRLINADAVFSPSRRFAVLQGDQILGEGYLRQGRGFINDIRDTAEEQGDVETQAMAEIYRGDFNVLMEINSGTRDYERAMELLLEAGIEQTRIDAFFAIPMPIPVPSFFNRFEQLERYQQQLLKQVEATEEGLTHVGVFNAWAEAAAAVQKPVSANQLLNVELPENRVELSFNISSRGKTSAIDVIGAEPAERRVEREAWRALRNIKFRPYFSDGRTRRLRDLQIRYVFAAEE